MESHKAKALPSMRGVGRFGIGFSKINCLAQRIGKSDAADAAKTQYFKGRLCGLFVFSGMHFSPAKARTPEPNSLGVKALMPSDRF